VIGEEIPRSLVVVSSTDTLTSMAKTLLKMGILKEGDWTGDGDIVQSVANGISRWADEELGCASLVHFQNYEITYTDNPEAFSLDPERFLENVKKPTEHELPLCGLGMLAPHYKLLDWEPIHQVLEEQLGEEVAWSVYSILIRALNDVVGCCCPRFVDEYINSWWGAWQDEQGDDIDPADFRLYFPEQVFTLPCDRKAMQRALETNAGQKYEALLSAALEVEAILESGWEGNLFSEAGYYTEEAMGPYLAACIDWGSARFSEEGHSHVTRFMDDYNENNAQVMCDDLIWRYPFQIGGWEWSIERAFTALETSLIVLALCDKMLISATALVEMRVTV
jgi:hypothetical protein